ncbi:MAG: CatA-like O-acetyltransferase [Bacilli bacterium]|jgi:chloramphenicol O-acetyltransferase type A
MNKQVKTEIDIKTYKKRNIFYRFKTFPDSSYGFDVDINVDKVVRLSKQRKESFFAYFMFLVMKAMDPIYELHLRYEKGHVYYYKIIAPTYTVMTNDGVYVDCGNEMNDDFREFYQDLRDKVEKAKKITIGDELDSFPICVRQDVVYATCIPTLNFAGMNHPTPANNLDSLSVPRICWGKYHLASDNQYHLMINITVSHALVDGLPLAQAFNNLQELAFKADSILVA